TKPTKRHEKISAECLLFRVFRASRSKKMVLCCGAQHRDSRHETHETTRKNIGGVPVVSCF
ncbi:hypothetical protein, partial [Pseudomonas sp. MWU12-2115]|uniref:hypothetical protein n=1 Tax=Pseudomonas sp. MWU12-2115 TaxID=2071713 RepID=UPI001C49AB0D